MVGTNPENFKREREMRLSGYITGGLLWLFSMSSSAVEITIAENGRSRCAVVVAEDARLPEQHAAVELVYFLEQITEAEIPLVHEALVFMWRVSTGFTLGLWLLARFSLLQTMV